MKKPYRKLTPELLVEIASKYKTRRAFYDADPSAFVSASRRKHTVVSEDGEKKDIRLLDHICTHMVEGKRKWARKHIADEAKKYGTRTAFSKGNRPAYAAAQRYGLLDSVCAHMTKPQKKKEMA